MNKLVVNEEGFIDLRSNPPPTTVTVQGGVTLPEAPAQSVPIQHAPPPVPKDVPLPAVQKTTEGLEQSAAPPVAVVTRVAVALHRIESANGPQCHAIVGANQFKRLAKHQWSGTRTGHMFRRVASASGVVTVLWFHREAAKCYRADRFVAFLDGDERNCTHGNLKVVSTKEEAKALRQQALQRSTHAQA